MLLADYPLWYRIACVAFLLMALGLAYLEGSGRVQLAYSKFRRGGGISTRSAMLFLYSAPIVVYLAGWWLAGRPAGLYSIVLLAMFVFHFGKRDLETLFLHKYSKPIGWFTPILIASLYSTLALGSQIAHDWLGPPAGDLALRLYIGLLLFAIGQIMNFQHHRLLANLRSGGDASYKVPSGGLFDLVACPHYLFELIGWLGFAIVSGHPIVFALWFVMVGYLGGRSRQTLVWYRENLPGFPAERRALVPYVF